MKKLATRATKKVRLSDLLLSPDDHRGHLIKVKLNLKRIIRIDDPKSIKQHDVLYELWGTTQESKAHSYYLCVTTELPDGMPLGNDLGVVNEAVTFIGYFLKLQGYEDSKSTKKKIAPLLIGRLKWHPHSVATIATDSVSDSSAVWWVAGITIAFLGFLGLRMYLKKSESKYHYGSDSRSHEGNEEGFTTWLKSPDDARQTNKDRSVDQECIRRSRIRSPNLAKSGNRPIDRNKR